MDLDKIDNLIKNNQISELKQFITENGSEKFNFLLMLSVAKDLSSQVKNEEHDVQLKDEQIYLNKILSDNVLPRYQ
jgi:hypothetical protein